MSRVKRPDEWHSSISQCGQIQKSPRIWRRSSVSETSPKIPCILTRDLWLSMGGIGIALIILILMTLNYCFLIYFTCPVLSSSSAGIGRTGTFIALDYLLDKGFKEGNVDVKHCVITLRQQRAFSIQSVVRFCAGVCGISYQCQNMILILL